MKNTYYIFIILLIFSCKKEKEYVFTDDEAYKLVNEYFIKEISKRDTFLLFNSRQLKQPDKEFLSTFETEEDSILDILSDFEKGVIPLNIEPPNPYPIFTKKSWKVKKLRKVKIINSKEWFSFFNKDSIKINKIIWDKKYDFHNAHNVSYPVYFPKTKLAIIKDYEYKPFWRGCIVEDNILIFRRVDSIWILL